MKKWSLLNVIRMVGIVVIVAGGISMIALDFAGSYRDFREQSERMRERLVNEQKNIVKQEVVQAGRFICERLANAEKDAKNRVAGRTGEGCAIAEHIYKKNRGKKSDAEIQAMILDALRPIRFFQGTGYYFITRLDGVEILFADRPQLEGENLLSLRDPDGKEVIRDMIAIASRQGEGFYCYRWTKPGKAENTFEKVAFVKRFEPYNWLIGCGLYLEDVEGQILKNVLDRLSYIRFGREGYLFVNRYNGDALVSNGKLFSGQNKLWEEFPEHRERLEKIFQQEMEAAQKPEGDFIAYSFRQLNSEKLSTKVSFVKGLPRLGWLVGAGFYTDEIEGQIVAATAGLKKELWRRSAYNAAVIFATVLLFLFILWLLNQKIKTRLNLFFDFFARAARSDALFDRSQISFAEFDQIADHANRMLVDKRTAQSALFEEKEKLFVTLRSIGDAVVSTDRSGRVEMMNEVAERLTGWSAEDARGKELGEIFPIVNAKTGERAENPVQKVLEQGKTVGLANHTKLVARDGVEYQIADSAAPIRDGDGNTRGVVLVFRDVTEQYRKDEELRQLEKLRSIGALAGGLAHDFNNIMMGLFGNISLAKMKLEADNPALPFIDKAERSLERATGLTNQLLTFAKGGVPIREEVSLPELIEQTAQFDLSGSSVKTVFETAPDLWKGNVDPAQMHQVFSNLTINARQAMPEGGLLTFVIKNCVLSPGDAPGLPAGKYIKITVADQGCGIAKQDLDRIFDPYFTTKHDGRGLGLATAYSIVSKHSGLIEADSEVGRGSTFTLYLPAADPGALPVAAGKKAGENGRSPKKMRIMIMDDEEMVREVVGEMLEVSDFDVETAADGAEALELYRQAMEANRRFDGVIMDITIPGGMGGKEAVRKLLDMDPGAKAIVSSGYADDPVMACYEEYGFKGAIAKPFRLDALKKEIARVLDIAEG